MLAENFSLKSRLYTVTVSTVLGLILLASAIIISTKYIDKINSISTLLKSLTNKTLELKISEKNFNQSKDLLYKLQFQSTINEILIETNILKAQLEELNIDINGIEAFENRVYIYESIFKDIIDLNKKIGLTYDEGLHKLYHDSSKAFEEVIRSQTNKDLIIDFLELRENEKQFLITKDSKKIEEFQINASNFLKKYSSLNEVELENFKIYKDNFIKIAQAEITLGKSNYDGLYRKMSNHIKRSIKLQNKTHVDLQNRIDEKIQEIHLYTIWFCMIVIFIVLYLLNSIKNTVLGPVTKLLEDYKEIVDASAIVSKTDNRGVITYVNDEMCKISGYSKDELVGNHHNILRSPDNSKQFFKDMWHTIKVNKQTWKGVIKNKRKDGTPYWVKSVIKPILDKHNRVIEYIALRSDVTDIEENKEYLQSQYSITSEKYEDVRRISKYYEDAMNKSSIIIRISKGLVINYVNDNFCEFTGYSKDELVNESYLKLVHPDVPFNEIEDLFEETHRNGIWKGQLKGFTKNGKEIHFHATVVPIKDKEGNLIEYISIRHNITKIIDLYNELEETQKEIVYKMGEIAESRSEETGIHVKRVAEYSKLLGTLAGLDEKEANLLKFASPMHDLGKVAIPDAVLNKPAKLTEDEFEVMKTHSTIGYNVLKTSKRKILKAASIIAHEHHEKWDGTGYPRNLKGEEIHIYGRITAICDVFDALAHDRVYKKAWPLEKIYELLRDGSGKHFDPNLIELFFENLDKFLALKKEFESKY